jgi:hypothetical protein
VLELDLRIEDDVVVELIGWQQHEPRGVEAGLPLPLGVRILLRSEAEFAIGADLEAGEGRWGDAEEIVIGGRRRFERGCFLGAEIARRGFQAAAGALLRGGVGPGMVGWP